MSRETRTLRPEGRAGVAPMARTPPAESLLAALPAESLPIARALIAAADRERVALHAVGGPVRDLLLGRAVRDVDLIVEPRDEQDAQALLRVAELPGARIVVHDRFGTLRVELGAGAVDVATVRRERYAHPGALPDVEPGTLDEDLRRRDFSVNALAIPLSRSARAARTTLVDVEDGLGDLQTKTLRILHPRSFHDDPTRALRAARLAARLDFSLSRGTRAGLRDALRDGVFGRVSGERLRRELERLFDDARHGLDPALALKLLADWHVLAALEPGLVLPRASQAPLRRLGRAIADPPWPTRARAAVAGLMVWLAPLDAALRGRALRRFAVRGEVATRVVAFATLARSALRALAKARGRGAIDAVIAPLGPEETLALHAVAPPVLRRRIVRHELEDRAKRLPISGDDLTTLGLAGPAVGRALARIRIAFLDGAVKDRDDALALARELARRRTAGRTRPRRVVRPASAPDRGGAGRALASERSAAPGRPTAPAVDAAPARRARRRPAAAKAVTPPPAATESE